MIFINPHKCCTFVSEKSCLTSNANLCIIQKLKLLPSHYLYWGETLVNRSFLAIRHILAEFYIKNYRKYIFLCIFVTKYNKQNFYSLISETSNEPIIQDITIGFAHSCMYTTHHASTHTRLQTRTGSPSTAHQLRTQRAHPYKRCNEYF